jgi:hypothetical protein
LIYRFWLPLSVLWFTDQILITLWFTDSDYPCLSFKFSYLKMGDCKTRNETKQDKAETKRDATQQKWNETKIPSESGVTLHYSTILP